MRKRIRGNPIFLVASFIAMTAWAGVLVYNLALGGYDMFTLEGCVKGFVEADADRKIAIEHMPATGDIKVAAQNMFDLSKSFEERVEALTCPSSVKEEQTAFVESNARHRILLASVARYGLPKDPYAEQLFWVQYEDMGGKATVALEALKKAISDEYLSQHPQDAAQAAPAQ